jgi:hypothetical protein
MALAARLVAPPSLYGYEPYILLLHNVLPVIRKQSPAGSATFRKEVDR